MYDKYFHYRNVNPDYYHDYRLAGYIKRVLPANKDAAILDIGCGFGQMLLALRALGYTNLAGIDLADEAVHTCQNSGMDVVKSSVDEFSTGSLCRRFDFLIMSHVLEHIDKPAIIPILSLIRDRLMKPQATFVVMVPNA